MKVLFTGLGSIGQRHLRNLRKLLGNSVEILAYRVLREAPMLDDQLQVVKSGSIRDQYNIIEFNDLDIALAQKPEIAASSAPSTTIRVTACQPQ